MSELPQGWAEFNLKALGGTQGGKTPSKSVPAYWTNGTIPWTSPKDMKSFLLKNSEDKISELAIKSGGMKLLPKDSVLFVTRSGILSHTIPVALTAIETTINQDIKAVTPNEVTLPKYLAYLLKGMEREILEGCSKDGTTVASVETELLERKAFPLAPHTEQKRIAAKLDALLARVDATREHLDRIPTLLKRFRQSVLAAATSGRLTEDWRAQHEAKVESVSPVRRSDTEQPPPKGQVEFTPAAWAICKVKDAGKVQLGRQRSPKFHSGENMRPYLRVQNVFEDRIDLSDVMEMVFSGADFERYQLHYGDILLNEGQSPELLGRPAMYRGELPGACFTNTLIRFQAYSHVKPDYALIVFRNHMHSGRYRAEGNITTNIAHLGAGRFAEVEFPLPPLEEQTEIVRRVEALFALADKVEARYTTARAQVTKLTPALLAKAFRGELVEQDPNDEPAEQLLARLRVNIDTTHRARRGRKSHQDREQA
jgi:type I restriction enzyme S subunit